MNWKNWLLGVVIVLALAAGIGVAGLQIAAWWQVAMHGCGA